MAAVEPVQNFWLTVNGDETFSIRRPRYYLFMFNAESAHIFYIKTGISRCPPAQSEPEKRQTRKCWFRNECLLFRLVTLFHSVFIVLTQAVSCCYIRAHSTWRRDPPTGNFFSELERWITNCTSLQCHPPEIRHRRMSLGVIRRLSIHGTIKFYSDSIDVRLNMWNQIGRFPGVHPFHLSKSILLKSNRKTTQPCNTLTIVSSQLTSSSGAPVRTKPLVLALYFSVENIWSMLVF